MTVQELINELNLIPDKSLPIFIYALVTLPESEVHQIDSIDLSISDRVDINVTEFL